MVLDIGMIAILVSIIVALLGVAVAWGALSQRVSNQDSKIDANKKATEKDIERLHTENREDHRHIFSKLEEINRFMQGGKSG